MRMLPEIVLGILAVSLTVQADMLQLNSGQIVDGTLISADIGRIRFLASSGELKAYPVAEVRGVVFGDTEAKAPEAPSRSPTGNVPAPRAKGATVIPAGTVLTVRMVDSIESDASRMDETFRAGIAEDVIIGGETVARKGAAATVKVVRIEHSGKFKGREEVALTLTDVGIDGKSHEVMTGYAEVTGKSKGKQTAKVVGASTAVGALIGAIAGGGKGAAIGAATGAGAGVTVQILRGERIQIPSESLLDFTLTEDVVVR